MNNRTAGDNRITALYERLSRDDELARRACSPGSKNAFSDWFKKTSLPYHLKIDPGAMTSQHFWDQMDGLTLEQLELAEDTITETITGLFPDDLDFLSLDYTNYYTFIDSNNARNDICRRGHNKQKRNDLRQFSLAALKPVYHWTDQKIRVHVFICLRSLLLGQMLMKEMEKNGIRISKDKMLDELNGIYDGWVIQSAIGKKMNFTRVLGKMTKEQEKLWKVVFKLNLYAPHKET
jgi:transposase